MHNSNKKNLTRIALICSLLLLVLWGILGTGASLAWFVDNGPTVQNSFVIGDMNLDVYYKNSIVTEYTPVEKDTPIFNEDALYEPGYVQVVYLKIVNNGNIDFDYKLAVDATSATIVKSVLGNDIYLPDYLKFGVVFGEDEATLTRELAKAKADKEFPENVGSFPLNIYSQKDDVTVAAGKERYAALLVYMPETVGNRANSNGESPIVNLGVTIFAQQAGTMR